MVTVKHRRADEDTWLEHDPIIPDGELALVSSECGYDIKIGNGVNSFSELPPLMGKHMIDDMDDYPSITLHHRDHISYSGIYCASVTLDFADHPDYTAVLMLRTMESLPEIRFTPAHICFSGCDFTDGVFVPRELKK